MRVSQFFLPLLKETPSEAQIVSHRLMLRAGMIRQLSSGIYTWLPLGWRVLQKVSQIVREEQDKAGAQEILMPTIQPAELWRESGRYEAYGKEMLRITDRAEREMLYGPTNEEVVTDVMRHSVKSYKQLPKILYHIQWKFRDEIRPRFGIMRGREFLMKDAYSFDVDYAGAKRSYELMYETYLRTFARMGLQAVPVRADSGAIGGDLSHEFHIVAETGESALFYDAAFDEIRSGALKLSAEEMRALYTAADERHVPEQCPIPSERLRQARGIEVGHIFYFGKKYSESMGMAVAGPDGQSVIPEMGSYGIGVSRLLGAIIEANHDEAGILWPDAVAPYHVGLINIRSGDAACDAAAESLYAELIHAGVEVLYDDTSESAGKKFASMDLIGLPWQMVIGPKGVAAGVAELKRRRGGEKQEISLTQIVAHVTRGAQ